MMGDYKTPWRLDGIYLRNIKNQCIGHFNADFSDETIGHIIQCVNERNQLQEQNSILTADNQKLQELVEALEETIVKKEDEWQQLRDRLDDRDVKIKSNLEQIKQLQHYNHKESQDNMRLSALVQELAMALDNANEYVGHSEEWLTNYELVNKATKEAKEAPAYGT